MKNGKINVYYAKNYMVNITHGRQLKQPFYKNIYMRKSQKRNTSLYKNPLYPERETIHGVDHADKERIADLYIRTSEQLQIHETESPGKTYKCPNCEKIHRRTGPK